MPVPCKCQHLSSISVKRSDSFAAAMDNSAAEQRSLRLIQPVQMIAAKATHTARLPHSSKPCSCKPKITAVWNRSVHVTSPATNNASCIEPDLLHCCMQTRHLQGIFVPLVQILRLQTQGHCSLDEIRACNESCIHLYIVGRHSRGGFVLLIEILRIQAHGHCSVEEVGVCDQRHCCDCPDE